MEMLETIKGLIGDRIWQSAEIETAQLDFCEYVRDACKANMCGVYGKTWMCPPGVGEVSELKEKCLKFKNAYVFTTKHDIEDSFDVEGMFAARDVHDELTKLLVDKLPRDKSMVLGAGGCKKCVKCSYPDAPCRFPDKAIPSVEACGIDVTILAKKTNINYINGACTVTYFTVVLYN